MTRVLLRRVRPASDLPAPEPGITLRDAACRLLDADGLLTRPVDHTYQPGEVYPELLVSNPAEPARGEVRITVTGDVLWDFRCAGPGVPGLTPCEVACAISGALEQARHACRGTEGTGA